MARRRKKLRPRTDGPLSPYAHHPRKPGIYVLYIDWPEKDRSCVHIYAEAFGAKRHLDILLKDLDFDISTDDDLVGLIDDKRWLVAENGLRVRCHLLQEILDHVDSPEEESWQMETRHKRAIEAFRYGEPKTPQEDLDQPRIDSPQESEKKIRRAKRRQENAEPRKPREKPDGMITVAMMAESLKILPREARARLRKASITKPDLGWMWPEAEAQKIEELIANG